jgi:ribonuclease BN (tRNA processing enzyme)
MRLTVLGGRGAWPDAVGACSGYLLEEDGFRLLVDPGYATLRPLLGFMDAPEVDAVLVSHGHPDHCADLNPLLRARALRDDPAPRLPVHTLPGALDAVLALDRPGMLDDAYALRDFEAGDRFEIGPFAVQSRALPHFTPNAGLRLESGGTVLAYTGDTGPSPEIALLARGADVLLAEASYAEHVPADSARYLSSARQAGEDAARAGAGRLLLTHLMYGTEPEPSLAAARRAYSGEVGVAGEGLVVRLGRG